jgi:F-type H+-transporting ATPase subunit b
MDLRVLGAASEGGEEEGGGNFLLPNGTFLFELLAFLVILFILGYFVVPPIQRAMRQRQQMVQQGIEDAQRARERAEATQRAYREELDEARAEGARIREKARAEADRLAGDKREQAQQEVAELHERGEAELRSQRERAAGELRDQVGGLALTLSGRILGTSPADDDPLRATIDGFLREMEPVSEADRGATTPAGTRSG